MGIVRIQAELSGLLPDPVGGVSGEDVGGEPEVPGEGGERLGRVGAGRFGEGKACQERSVVPEVARQGLSVFGRLVLLAVPTRPARPAE